MNSPLNITVSCFKTALSTEPKPVNLMTWLTSAKYKVQVEKIRNSKDKLEKAILKKQLPAITPSGTFSHRAINGLILHSGLLAFDIDFKGNEHINNYFDLKTQLSNVKNIAYCGLSVSGNGFWGLIPIKWPDKHESHFKGVEMAFKEMGIKIDPACKDVCRLRFYSFDPEGYFNHSAKVFTGLYEPKKTLKSVFLPLWRKNKSIETAVKMVSEANDGEKWQILSHAGYLLGGYVGSGSISEHEARQALETAICQKQNVNDLSAAFRTIDKAIKAGQNKPI
jgi:hypothetical protein